MARAAKSAVVLCMDVGFAMSHSNQGEEPPLEQAKKIMTLFLQRQVFAESKDETAVVLFGTDGTDNGLAARDQYQNITVLRHLYIPDFELLEKIQNEVEPGSQQADFLDALVVCMDILQKETLGKKFEKLHIAVFTDLSSPFIADQVEVIVANLKQAGITLQFFLPFPVDEEDDGPSDEPSGRGDAGNADGRRGPGKGLSDEQKAGIQMVWKIMFSLDGEDGLSEVYTFRESLEKLSIFKKIERRPMPWPCQLTIGSHLSIRIVGYKCVTEEKVKKSWTVVDAKTLNKEDVQKETVFCLDNDEETEIEKDETIQGFRYGSDIVPFAKVDQEQMKYKTEGKCFAVLGFTKSSLIDRNHYMGNQVIKIFAPKDDEAANVALSSLINALYEMEMVAIVRYAYDRRSNPQVGMAFPLVKEKYECLVYVQLPFMEDLRQYVFSSLANNKKFTPTDAQLSAVDSLIDSMSLVEDDGETVEDLFKPSKIPNPQFQRLFQCLQHRAISPDDPLPPIDQHLLNMLEPPSEVKARCQASLEKVKACFPLQEATKRKEQRTGQDIFEDKKEEPDSKKAKAEDEDFSVMRLADGNVTSVGSVTPAEDFRVLVRQKNRNFKEASDQLVNRISEFLDTKQTQYYAKSIGCIKTLRAEAIRMAEVRIFNDFLQTLKEKIEGALKEFWEIVVQDNISLITCEESEGSSVTPAQAKMFLAETEKKSEGVSVEEEEEEGDVDDLLDMM